MIEYISNKEKTPLSRVHIVCLLAAVIVTNKYLITAFINRQTIR
ncbi:hypothetical protein DHBDCA_p2489 [Dehalobacter sp. DCA]|nr:hypothetical protein DHBDCA_p2489 [Dehalobacter sp. DCA]